MSYKLYIEFRNILKKEGYAVRHFTRCACAAYIDDLARVRDLIAQGATNGEAWQGASVYATPLYNKAGDVYCRFLELYAAHEGARK